MSLGRSFKTTAPETRAKGVVKGHSKGSHKRIVVAFPPDTFDTINKLAVRSSTSFAEQVRMLVEWGLEDLGEGE